MQTEGQQQFRIHRRVCVVIGVCLIALALPLAGVILTLQSFTKRDSQRAQADESEVSGALKNMLEGIANQKLAPGELQGGEAKIELTTVDVKMERARIEALLKSFGGIAIPTAESEAEIRLLVQVPADRLADFRVACLGEGARAGDPSGSLLEIVIKKTKLQ